MTDWGGVRTTAFIGAVTNVARRGWQPSTGGLEGALCTCHKDDVTTGLRCSKCPGMVRAFSCLEHCGAAVGGSL